MIAPIGRFGPRLRRRLDGFSAAVAVSVGVFVVAGIAGFVLRSGYVRDPRRPESIGVVPGAVEIATVNGRVALLLAIGGFLLGAPTIISLTVNGVGFGMIVASILEVESPRFLALVLLPHGLFELPAIWLAGGIGLTVARRMIELVCGATGGITGVFLWRQLIRLGIVFGLVAVGAVVESAVTPWLVKSVGYCRGSLDP